jgi:hypothetical protein
LPRWKSDLAVFRRFAESRTAAGAGPVLLGSPALPDCGDEPGIPARYLLSFNSPRIDSHLSPPEAHTWLITALPPKALPVTESVVLPHISRGSIMPQSQPLSSVVPFAAIGRPSCPKCKAAMMLVSIELAGPGVDLHKFECAICNRVLESLTAYQDPMKSKGLGRWLQGDLHPPK